MFRAASIAALLALAVWGPGVGADSPPRWVERKAGPVVLIAPPGSERSLESLGPRAEGIVAQVSSALGIQPRAPYRMVLVPASGLRDPELIRLDRGAPPWAAGYMAPALRIGAIRLAQAARYPYGTPEAVLAHESAHLLIHDAPGVDVPLWFEEGAATWAARDWQFEDVFQISSRLLMHDLPRLDALEPQFRGSPDEVEQAYAAAFAFVSWSSARYGESLVRDVLSQARTHSFERAWKLATGEQLDRSESEWRRESLFRYRWLPLIAGSGSVWLLVMVIAFWVWVRRRRRAKALEAAWEEEEEEEGWEDEGGALAPLDSVSDRLSPLSGEESREQTAPPAVPPAAPGAIVWRRIDDAESDPKEGPGPS